MTLWPSETLGYPKASVLRASTAVSASSCHSSPLFKFHRSRPPLMTSSAVTIWSARGAAVIGSGLDLATRIAGLGPAHKAPQPVLQRNRRLVSQLERRLADVRAAALRLIGRVGIRILDPLDAQRQADYPLEHLRQLQHRELRGRRADVIGLPWAAVQQDLHESDEGIRHIAERAGLLAGAVHMQGPAADDPAGEIRQHTIVLLPHAGPIYVKRTHNFRRDPMRLVEDRADGLAEPLGFVVTGPRPETGDVPAIRFRCGHMLRVRVAVNLARAEVEEPAQFGLQPQRQHLLRAQRRHLQRLEGVLAIVVGAGDAGGLNHVIERLIERERLDDVLSEEAETILSGVGSALLGSRDQIVADDDLAWLRQVMRIQVGKQGREVAPQEPRTTAEQDGGTG